MAGRSSAQESVGVLLDVRRLAVAGALAVADRSLDELVDATDLDRRPILEALATLRTAGLVDTVDGMYRLNTSALQRLARAAATPSAGAAPSITADAPDDGAAILERFFEERRLTEIPANRSKRRVVLDRLAQEFEIGVAFPEAAVNETLREFHADVAALRRYLVDEEFLDRADGYYWRNGGRVDVTPR